MGKDAKRVLIVDQNNMFIRSYIVDPTLSKRGDRSGQPIGGLQGALKALQKITREVRPDKIIIVWDGEGGSRRRRSINKNYKDGRKPIRLNRTMENLSPEDEEENKFWQMIRLAEYYDRMPVVQLVPEMVEADDVIAYVAQIEELKDCGKVIVSSDKDFYQLLDDSTVLYRPVQNEIMTRGDVLDRYGIHPTNFALARAIVGDPSDNLRGIKGVGLPTVAKRFEFLSENKTHTIDDVLERCREPESTLRAYKNILADADVVKQNYQLMQLYNPSISISATNAIREDILNKDYTFKRSDLDLMMVKDGFSPWDWSSLYQTLNKIRDDT